MISVLLSVLLGTDTSSFLSFEFLETNLHPIIYTLLIAALIYLVFQQSYKPSATSPVTLTQAEKQMIIDHWKPKPLVAPEVRPLHQLDVDTIPVIDEHLGKIVKIAGSDYLNFSSYNFLGFGQSPLIKESAVSAIRRYGCGACGPRGFYGTLDVHLECEATSSQFIGTQNSILYSSGFACIASAIPAFALRGDFIVSDKGVKHAIQIGNYLSRSRVSYFEHNDMKHCEELMKKVYDDEVKRGTDKKNRRFLVFETLYQNHGSIAPLDKLFALAKKYKFRLIVDESCAVGVLGANGRGAIEHFGLDPKDFEIICFDLGYSLASIGGICTGRSSVVSFQRLNGLGYCFSAANPPYLVAAATTGLNEISKNPALIKTLQKNAAQARSFLTENLPPSTLAVTGDLNSPIIPITLSAEKATGDRFQDNVTLQKIVDAAFAQGILLSRAKFDDSQSFLPAPFINFCVSAEHTEEDISRAVKAITTAAKEIL
eukprot:TRINITY_DN959_c0_g1_i1.p1 TRINITY_DN959_c0_g1~~TRINITY_DN959_c0_g1_i1.p1  ORF type:complete len:485 (-),score=249.16 TRINITY_DN959_c0_g1_i1:80-1534(-)